MWASRAICLLERNRVLTGCFWPTATRPDLLGLSTTYKQRDKDRDRKAWWQHRPRKADVAPSTVLHCVSHGYYWYLCFTPHPLRASVWKSAPVWTFYPVSQRDARDRWEREPKPRYFIYVSFVELLAAFFFFFLSRHSGGDEHGAIRSPVSDTSVTPCGELSGFFQIWAKRNLLTQQAWLV